MRAVTWNRISHKSEMQILDNMKVSNREYVERQGWALEREYEEILSSKGITPGLEALLRDASARQFDVVVCGTISRFTRGGLEYAIDILNRLEGAGVKCHFVEQPFFNTDAGMPGLVRKPLLAFVSEIDKEYRMRIGRNTKRTLDDQKAKGTYRGGAGSHRLPCRCAVHRRRN